MPRLNVALRIPPPENASPTRLLSAAGRESFWPRRKSREVSTCRRSSLRTSSTVGELLVAAMFHLPIRVNSALTPLFVTGARKKGPASTTWECPAIGSERLGRTIVRYSRKAHGIVDHVQVGRLFLPFAAALSKLFALRLERLDPLPDDRSLIHARLEAAVAVVVFGHLGRARSFEEFLDLMIGELTHQAGIETPPFFADHRIAQAIVRGQAVAQHGLALPGSALGPNLVPELFAGPSLEIHFCRGIAGEPAAGAEGSAHVLHQ